MLVSGLWLALLMHVWAQIDRTSPEKPGAIFLFELGIERAIENCHRAWRAIWTAIMVGRR